MDVLDVFRSSILYTHEDLATRLDRASAMSHVPGQPRKGYEELDSFLAVASRHLSALDATLLATVRRQVPDGGHVVHDYLRTARRFELALAHAKARAYGSAYQVGRSWESVWREVAEALAAHRDHEFRVADLLAAQLGERELERLEVRLRAAEKRAPSRPHPYVPHTGPLGFVARRVMHAADAFWDMAEGRMLPEPARAPHPLPGPFTQYLLADPRFDEGGPAHGAA